MNVVKADGARNGIRLAKGRAPRFGGPRTVPVRSTSPSLKTSDFSDAPRPARALRTGTVRAPSNCQSITGGACVNMRPRATLGELPAGFKVRGTVFFRREVGSAENRSASAPAIQRRQPTHRSRPRVVKAWILLAEPGLAVDRSRPG